MFSLRGLLLAAGLTAGLAVGASVSAAPLSVTFEGVRPGSGNAGQYNWNSGTTSISGLVYTPFGNGSASANHFVTFCIERNQQINGGSTYTSYSFASLENSPNPGQPMSAETADNLRRMWAEYRDDLDVGTDAERAIKSAAFQHAVWSLVEANSQASVPVSEADYFALFLNSNTWRSGLANLMVMGSGNQQDQLVEFAPLAPDPVPEPGMLALGLLVAPALYLRRKLAAKAG